MSLTMVECDKYGNGEKYYFRYYRNSCKEDKILHQKHDFFYIQNTTDEIELTG